jgi:hypothetical protein
MNSSLVTTVICPHCHAEIDARRDICPHCSKPLHVGTQGGVTDARVIDRPWILAVLLLHVGFLGIPIYWKTNYSVATRLLVCAASIVYTVSAVWFIVVVGSWLYRQFMG